MAKVLLWDFDGTLSYPNKSFRTALHTAISEYGCRLDPAIVAAFTGTAYSWKSPDVTYPDAIGAAWWDTLFAKTTCFCTDHGIAAADIPAINHRFRAILTDVDNYCLYHDTIDTLKICAAMGYRNVLATNNYPEILENLDKLGLAPYFHGAAVSSLIGYEKPRAEFYAYAKRIADATGSVYMIGDNPSADIRGSMDAGCTAIAVHTCKGSDAAYYAEELSLIPALLRWEEQRS